MSRAFVKESSGEDEDVPERAISSHRNLVTPQGLAQIDAQLKRLESQLSWARERGDIALVSQSQRDLRYWAARRTTAEVVPLLAATGTVRFGSTVELTLTDGRLQRWCLVGEDEANPVDGLISYVSPLGQRLLGAQVGDEIKTGQGNASIDRVY